MRLVHFGSGAFGVPTLARLVEEHEVALVVTQPDRPAGRGRSLTPTPVATLAASRGLENIKPHNVNEPVVVEAIRAVRADAFVVIAYGQKLGPALLEGMYAINLHGSLLPKYRGAAPVSWAILSGERETGLSVITLAERMDAGAILGQCSTPIDPMETAGELHDRLAELGPALVLDVLARHESGTLQPVAQDETRATRAAKLTKADGRVSFDQPAAQVQQRVHGLTPWPGCTVRVDDRPLLVARVRVASDEAVDAPPGEIMPDLTVACSPGLVEFLEVRPAGGRTMLFAEYCRGHHVKPGLRLEPQ